MATTIKASNQISLLDISDAYSVILTSEAYTFVGGTSGVGSGASCKTQAVAYCGTNQCSSVIVDASSITCPTGITASVTDSGSAAPTITFTTNATVADACEATIPVQVGEITINKKFSFAVAKTGATGAKGATGKGIKSTAIAYQASTSGTTVPTGTWSGSVPTVSAGQYLWTRTVTTYTDNSTTTAYSVGMMGATGNKGDTGKGVKSTAVTYQVGTSGTTAPTGTWSGSPVSTTAAGQYLWTRTVITYTDSSTSTSYSIAAHGAKGNTGATGASGADALTLSITSSAGTVFKNSNGSTVLTAHVYKAGAEQTVNATTGVVANSLGTIKWYKSTAPNTVLATAGTLTVQATDVDNVAAYTCQLEG